MTENPLGTILENLKTAHVVVVGDIMLDRFITGNVDRISPESPVPVLSIKDENKMLGGAGNALANLTGLGVKADIIALIGDDEDGKTVQSLVQSLGSDAKNLVVDASRPTIVKSRFLAGHQQLLRTDFENKQSVDDNTANQIIEQAKKAIEGAGAVIISDYGKGVLRADVIAAIIAAAKAKTIPVIVDPKGQDFSIYKGGKQFKLRKFTS